MTSMWKETPWHIKIVVRSISKHIHLFVCSSHFVTNKDISFIQEQTGMLNTNEKIKLITIVLQLRYARVCFTKINVLKMIYQYPNNYQLKVTLKAYWTYIHALRKNDYEWKLFKFINPHLLSYSSWRCIFIHHMLRN